jgi:hypothetical protein
MMRPETVEESEADVARAVARWAEALVTAKELKARLLQPDPGDVRAAVALLEDQVRAAAAVPIGGGEDRDGLRRSLRGVLTEFAETTAQLGRVADARAKTAHGVLRLFQRADLPPGSLLDL